ncbi:class I SAM-dependent methyltransferase [Xanthomonas hortorum]|uniref:Class I SAM-dependent methyltransferase n=2 Tax=Xanthomonas hortorum TaxID=56454 RepID=A0A6V7DK72_9XANT|nr:class I SAM-dependent methyltransferase [Xanthomonas hortorum]MCC4623270.1 methyltransferase domain-containing protein [Xanthomonas campestris pv. nigromaculans]APP81283.1 SAM-dependent methyltransferase [Xanthomonas hortorum pv. gardneri]APP84266.1 SAM-dependent methyltransferase [Xanthomonas hortorum pv. gardneri]ASW45818.1 methyltransferase [Xanthomonas hortorum]EGD19756.1 methyltransferase family protein [Xanthomonas hortorum ATCC 19865]
MSVGFPALRDRLQQLSELESIDGVFVQRSLADDPFEQQYLEIRRKEGRLYTDAQVRSLPRPSGKLGMTLEWRVRALSSALLVQHLQARAGEGAILELGCGNGWLSQLLAQSLQRDVCGIDVNRTELTQAARVFGHDQRLSFIAADIQTLALPRDLFDVIVLPACIQYFADPAALVIRLLAQLRDGGELHILDSPLYADPQRASESAARSLHYFTELGVPALAAHYHQHTYATFDRFAVQWLFDPRRPSARLRRMFKLKQLHFPWLCLRKQDNIEAIRG